MTLAESRSLPFGLYEVHWKSGGSSYAAIGMDHNGYRWIAPCNWNEPAFVSHNLWRTIARVEPILTGITPSSKRLIRAMHDTEGEASHDGRSGNLE